MSKLLVYIVDDESDILQLVKITLNKDNFISEEFDSGKNFLKALEKRVPHFIILDLMLPDSNGFEICKKLKSNAQYAHIPIILLTARDSESDKVLGLELGADDYITKPFSPRELNARIHNILRRVSHPHVSNTVKQYRDIIQLDEKRHKVYVYDTLVTLTSVEFKILSKFLDTPQWVLSREDLLSFLWGNTKLVSDRTIDVHIKHIRSKIEKATNKKVDFIKNVRGIGYKLE